jgi:flagellar biosynthesis protein FlhG
VDQAGVLRKMKKMEDQISKINPVSEQKGCNEDARVIAITSGKGGVGKTNIAANFAYILSMMGESILLIDADTGLANIDILLGITPQYNLGHVLHGEKSLSEVIIQGPGGIKILPSASGIQEMAELSKGQKLTLLDAINDLNERLDFVFIDTGAGIAGNVMYFNMAAKEIIVVVSSEPTSLTDAYALIKVLYQGYSEKRFMILVNMVKSSNEALSVFRKLSNATDHFLNLSVEYLGYVPCDNSVSEAVKKQHLLADIFPSSKATRCLFSIAKKLCQERPGPYENGTMKFFSKAIVDRDGK